MNSTKSDRDKLWDMIKQIRFGMLTHRHADGKLHAHPLTTQNKKIDESGRLYFFVTRASELGQRVQQDGNVNLTYADHDKDVYVSIAGQARVSEDDDTKQRLFNALTRAWFPGGWKDPNLELLEVKIEHAEYWDTKESKVTQLFIMATAAVTGTPARMGEKRELHLS